MLLIFTISCSGAWEASENRTTQIELGLQSSALESNSGEENLRIGFFPDEALKNAAEPPSEV